MDDDSPRIVPVLDIYNLGHLARTLVDAHAAMAIICMNRHHQSPVVWTVAIDGNPASEYEVSWQVPTDQDRRAYDNEEESTEYGACSLALAAAQAHLGLVPYARAKPRTGVDFYLLTAHADISSIVSYDYDHADFVGLEVSGIDLDTEAAMKNRFERRWSRYSADDHLTAPLRVLLASGAHE